MKSELCRSLLLGPDLMVTHITSFVRTVKPQRLECWAHIVLQHYDDVIMTMLASQITSIAVVYSIVYSGVNQRKHQSSASLAFVREIHRGPVNFPHKWPVTRKMFPFDDVIMVLRQLILVSVRVTKNRMKLMLILVSILTSGL